MTTGRKADMTDKAIRDMFGLDASVDLDKPLHHLEFMTYREAAKAYVEKWGDRQ
jgi:hypothetical protein